MWGVSLQGGFIKRLPDLWEVIGQERGFRGYLTKLTANCWSTEVHFPLKWIFHLILFVKAHLNFIWESNAAAARQIKALCYAKKNSQCDVPSVRATSCCEDDCDRWRRIPGWSFFPSFSLPGPKAPERLKRKNPFTRSAERAHHQQEAEIFKVKSRLHALKKRIIHLQMTARARARAICLTS